MDEHGSSGLDAPVQETQFHHIYTSLTARVLHLVCLCPHHEDATPDSDSGDDRSEKMLLDYIEEQIYYLCLFLNRMTQSLGCQEQELRF